MNNLQFVSEHGYSVLFLWVIAEQAGLPIPAIPILLAAGALSATGSMSLPLALLITLIAAVGADCVWYEIGRRKGMKVLNFLCRVSLEPDSCVRQTELAFSNQGMRALLIAKFVPGLNTAAPPLAGIFKTPLTRFLLFDTLGTLLWAGTFLALGRIFSHQLEAITKRVLELGGSLLQVVIALLIAYVAFKWIKRQLFLRELRVMRLEPDELKSMMDSGHDVFVIDLRHPFDFESAPHSIVGALRMSPEEIEHKHDLIPRDRDVILYCT
ncbi:MAG TPA: VTT domain-containing protein [Terriglobales bacterium]|nr:VTT domain-containing protein [Terriglobales bacterium]